MLANSLLLQINNTGLCQIDSVWPNYIVLCVMEDCSKWLNSENSIDSIFLFAESFWLRFRLCASWKLLEN